MELTTNLFIDNIETKTPEETITEIEQYIQSIKNRLPKITTVKLAFNSNTKAILTNYIVSDTLNVNGTVYQFEDVLISDGYFRFKFLS